jgi:hypothetical protein
LICGVLSANGKKPGGSGSGNLGPASTHDLEDTSAMDEQPDVGRQIAIGSAGFPNPILRLFDQDQPMLDQR